MDWALDTRVGISTSALADEVLAHLQRHALDPETIDLAGPMVSSMLMELPEGSFWVSLDWEGQQPALRIALLEDDRLPGESIASGVTRAHEEGGRTPDRRTGAIAWHSAVLPVSRPLEPPLDPVPRQVGEPAEISAVSALGVIADELAAGRSVEEAAARTGVTLAGSVARQNTPEPDAGAIAKEFIEAEAQLGGQFHLVSVDGRRAVLGNRGCPFGAAARPGLCRFTSALAGSLAARAAGGAEITLDERLVLGDHQCRLIIDLGPPSGRPTSHPYTWPPAGTPSTDTDEHAALTKGFRVTLTLQLPRDRLSVPVTRHLIQAAMREVGVIPAHIEEVGLAVSEACANVISHSGPGDAYQVAVTVGPASCHIRVVDIGHGFDHQALDHSMASLDAEHGRGVALMHALVDQVRFESRPEAGTVVHLVKHLKFDDSIPARRLMLENEHG
jgi:serine/threonine-protein kinase RsbW